jgi:uncharacterized membrane protein YcaP (DUF421 family)
MPPALTATRQAGTEERKSIMWFDSWSDLVRVVIVGAAAYAFLIITLRLSGKRTLSQMNAFDFIVTVALGSTLATILLSADVSWAEGTTALALLAALQLLVAWFSTRWPLFRRAVTSRPVLLVREGALDPAQIRANRLTESQVMQAVRSGGYGDLALVGAVVLEPNGTLSVVGRDTLGTGSALPGGDAA